MDNYISIYFLWISHPYTFIQHDKLMCYKQDYAVWKMVVTYECKITVCVKQEVQLNTIKQLAKQDSVKQTCLLSCGF